MPRELTKSVNLMDVGYSRKEEWRTYFELDCRICDQSGRDREKHPLGGAGLHRPSRRGRCMGGLPSLSISGVEVTLPKYGAYGSLERSPVLEGASSQ